MIPRLISGWPKPGAVAGDADVAGQRQLAAAAQREAVDHRDGRLRARGDLVEDAPVPVIASRCSSGVRSANSGMSAPATKAFSPAPVSTTTRTSSSAQRVERLDQLAADPRSARCASPAGRW
jgi:hypothetical protein